MHQPVEIALTDPAFDPLRGLGIGEWHVEDRSKVLGEAAVAVYSQTD